MLKQWRYTLFLSLLVCGVGIAPASPARAQGDALSFDLTWEGSADLDLLVQEPDGTQIHYDAPSSASGGSLDATQGNNFCATNSDNPTETVSWEEAQTGEYWVNVSLFDACGAGEGQPFTLTITGAGGRVLEQLQGVVFLGEDNNRSLNFVYPGSAAFPASTPDEDAPVPFSGLGALFGEAALPPTALASPVPGAGPLDMGGETAVITVPRGPLHVQLTWANVPDFDLDLMAKELGTMIAYDEPISASGGELSSDFGNAFCAGQTLPDRDLYGEEIVWSDEPLGSTLEVYVALIGICGPSGFVLPGDETAEFTFAVYDAGGRALYGPVQKTTGEGGMWGLTLQFSE